MRAETVGHGVRRAWRRLEEGQESMKPWGARMYYYELTRATTSPMTMMKPRRWVSVGTNLMPSATRMLIMSIGAGSGSHDVVEKKQDGGWTGAVGGSATAGADTDPPIVSSVISSSSVWIWDYAPGR